MAAQHLFDVRPNPVKHPPKKLTTMDEILFNVTQFANDWSLPVDEEK